MGKFLRCRTSFDDIQRLSHSYIILQTCYHRIIRAIQKRLFPACGLRWLVLRRCVFKADVCGGLRGNRGARWHKTDRAFALLLLFLFIVFFCVSYFSSSSSSCCCCCGCCCVCWLWLLLWLLLLCSNFPMFSGMQIRPCTWPKKTVASLMWTLGTAENCTSLGCVLLVIDIGANNVHL